MSAFEDNSGKIAEIAFKEEILPFCGFERKEVIMGPSFGVDTSVIDIGNDLAMAVSSDPLSLIPAIGMEASAWLSVHLMVNDLATTGIAPQYAQFVLNLPSTLSRQEFSEYWGHIHRFCKDVGVAITGGHTGQIPRLNSTISGGGTMFLVSGKENILTSNNATPGDVIVVTKEAALTATSILSLCFPETVKNALGKDTALKTQKNFYHTSSLKEALLASSILTPNVELKAMHDVTEGGILGAINEMAIASDCGFQVKYELLPVSPEVKAVADLFKIDPFLSVGAGSMIMAVKEGHESRLINHLKSNSIEAAVVGNFTEQKEGYTIEENEKKLNFNFEGKDPYWEAFFNAFNAGFK